MKHITQHAACQWTLIFLLLLAGACGGTRPEPGPEPAVVPDTLAVLPPDDNKPKPLPEPVPGPVPEPIPEPVPPGTLLTVMTYNIRYANPGDLLNHWSFRKAAAYNVIRAQLPDVMGTQEVLHSQLQDLREALPGYGYVGVGREDGKTRGEYCALFYRTERFDLLEGATFWLSATPDKPGKGWDAACERVVSWAKLKEKAGGKIFFAFNTHFDHVGSVARRESATLLKEEIRKIAGNAPVIVTGDFNAVATDEPIRLLTGATDPDHLTDTREISPLIEGPRYSFHDFGKVAEAKGRLIDYIFVKNVSVVTRVQVLDRAVTGSYISDHYPVLAVIEL